jgi:endonuclease YncB( thermonuclease family)
LVSVGDADNFRVYHTPGFGWNWLRSVPKKKSGEATEIIRFFEENTFSLFLTFELPLLADLKDMTIHVRLAGVDAPEVRILSRCYPYAFASFSNL